MNHETLARSLRLALALGLAAASQGASAAPVDFAVTVPASNPVTPALANAVSQNHPSSLYLAASNTRATTNVTQVVFTLPAGYVTQASGGLGPVGWTLTRVEKGKVFFKLADCATGGTYGIQAGTAHASQTFRIDVVPPGGGINNDVTDHLGGAAPSDPCGGTKGWTTTSGGNILFQRKVLWVTASAPLSGPSPLAASVLFTVKNESGAAKSAVSLGAVAVTASAGATFTSSGCAPATFSLAKTASQVVTCSYVLTAVPGGGSSFTFAATASGTTSATAVGAIAGPVLVGPATAAFAFDSLVTAPGDTVGATFSVTNQTAGTITATPPTYAQLTLSNLQRAAGASDPSPASIGAGATAAFTYTFLVPASTPLSSSYLAAGTASTTAGPTNGATTPPGTVGAVLVDWTPSAIVKARVNSGAGPFPFTVTVLNTSASAIQEIDVINPQNGSWTTIANGGATGLSYSKKTTAGSVDTLVYTGTLAIGAIATLNFRFTDISPNAGDNISATKVYPFQVRVKPANAANLTVTQNLSVADTFPIGDVANASVLSGSAGQTVYWTNTDTPAKNEVHDGVVIFVTAAGTVPPNPADGADYAVDALPSGVIRSYADGGGSQAISWVDADSGGTPAAPGAFSYRICNHDANYIYSDCKSGFWNGFGYVDSVSLPPGVSWAHTVGMGVWGYPGVWQGRVAFASNARSLAVLDVATGQRPFSPAALSALPNVGTPAAPVNGGAATLAFGADANGGVVALDLAGGATPPGWTAAKAGEAFVGGIAGVLAQYVGASYQGLYATDLLLLGSSTTGTLHGIDARSGATLWTKARATAGATIGTQPHYDYGTNALYVAYDNGGGVVAYGGIGTGSAPATPLWAQPGASYVTPCTFGSGAGQVACVESGGTLHVLDAATGADLLGTSGVATGVPNALSLWPVGDGYVVSNASTVKRLVVSGGSVTATHTYSPGLGLSPVLVSAGDGFVYVPASDRTIRKLSLATLADTGLSRALNPTGASPTLAAPAMDVADNLILLGSSDGRLWAVPLF